MSKRRFPGDVVIKKAGAGYCGPRARVRIEPENDPMPCVLYSEDGEYCDDPECREWASCTGVDRAGVLNGKVYSHVSKCEMEDAG